MLTVGFLQYYPTRYSVEENIQKVQQLSAGLQADVLVLPELANSGYTYASPRDLSPYAEPGDGSGPFLSALKAVAAQIHGVIVTGFAERIDDRLYNSAAAVSADGVISLYRKTHLFLDELDLFLPGDTGYKVFDYQGVKIGMMICFDWFFPEAARTLALNGAQILAHPSNLVLPYCQQGMLTRSLENAVYSITCNRYGPEELNGKTVNFTGQSQVVDPKGSLLIRAREEGDAVNVVSIDPALALNKKITPRNDLFGDRRPDLYFTQNYSTEVSSIERTINEG
jgi:predicted amidohydrolase